MIGASLTKAKKAANLHSVALQPTEIHTLQFPSLERLLAPIPAPAFLYIALFILYAMLMIWGLVRSGRFVRKGEFERAFLAVAALIAAFVLINTGHDSVHHVLRLKAWTGQLWRGDFSPMIENPDTGEVVPLFLFYSVVPYLVPAALVLFGISPEIALQLSLVILFLVFAVGVHRLIATIAPQSERELAFCAGILLLTANYVYLNWIGRAALAEVWAYALIPSAILYARDQANFAKLVLVFFLQICAHPLVFHYAFVGYFAAAYLLCGRPFFALLKTSASAALFALVLTIPFWGPAIFYMKEVLGLRGLPLDFGGTFQRPWKLLDPLALPTLGPVLILTCIAIFVIAVRERHLKLACGIVAMFAMLVVQTDLLRDFVVRLPFVDETQFIWRLMFPTAILAFAIVLSFAINQGRFHRVAMTRAAVLALLMVGLKLGVGLPRSIGHSQEIFQPSPWTVGTFFVNFPSDNLRAWGVRLFSPDYRRLETHCPALADGEYSEASYAAARSSFVSTTRFIAIDAAPHGFVRYLGDDKEVQLRHCDRKLVVGPVLQGTRISVDESFLARLQALRISTLVAVLLGVALVGALRSRRGGLPSPEPRDARS